MENHTFSLRFWAIVHLHAQCSAKAASSVIVKEYSLGVVCAVFLIQCIFVGREIKCILHCEVQQAC